MRLQQAQQPTVVPPADFAQHTVVKSSRGCEKKAEARGTKRGQTSRGAQGWRKTFLTATGMLAALRPVQASGLPLPGGPRGCGTMLGLCHEAQVTYETTVSASAPGPNGSVQSCTSPYTMMAAARFCLEAAAARHGTLIRGPTLVGSRTLDPGYNAGGIGMVACVYACTIEICV